MTVLTEQLPVPVHPFLPFRSLGIPCYSFYFRLVLNIDSYLSCFYYSRISALRLVLLRFLILWWALASSPRRSCCVILAKSFTSLTTDSGGIRGAKLLETATASRSPLPDLLETNIYFLFSLHLPLSQYVFSTLVVYLGKHRDSLPHSVERLLHHWLRP